eukprot:gnl/MRDRNA2_/MRDRNA2_88342_c0_seq1.p2 gnl/MRDRNA2_/MRDRNA2_88342_c0~~gnl/MRDRNA2_/MRDRNA2_88342_c0_seq1.p2  ORF type:complete len:137 (-),score=30.78 gnl/MRDRNA2_/MRDRNA2_88342_c0_seq1:231-641(-)
MAIDYASKAQGGKVLMVSSLDERHLGENIIDGSDNTYWISTGLYPQEVLVELGQPINASQIKILTTNVKNFRVEGCSEDTPVNFKTLAESELESKGNRLQSKDIQIKADEKLHFIKVMILSGWHDFCSVHKIIAQE